MKKIIFLLKSVKLSSLKTLFEVTKKVKKQSNKKFVIFDILKCSFKYEAAFYDYLEFEFYLLNDEQRKTYLTSGKNNQIVKIFNDKNYWHILDNKNEFNNHFKKYLKRDFLNPHFTKEQLNIFLKDKSNIMAKPIDGVGGEGIKIINSKDKNIYENYNNYLLEEIIIQDPKLAELYDKSVNSIRMFTFFDGEKAYLLQSILKIGNGGYVDNFSSYGMYAFLNDKGTVITPAIDKNDNIYGIHPISKKQILNFQVPQFEQAKELILKAAKDLPQIQYIGWDVAISNNGPCIIEGNSYPGIFQIKPRFSKDKIGILPKYEKIMKINLQ